MPHEIITIRLSLPLKLGNVNCYLMKTDGGYVLIDTGGSNKRAELEKELENAGCRPGNLKLIVLTHGDFDHTGNAAHLRQRFGSQIAMHADDSGMVEHGDMFLNRKRPNMLARKLVPTLFRFGRAQRFTPDIYLDEGDDLSEYGFDARVVCIPGHSKGSIGILTANGDLLCGDLFENTDKPVLNSLMDDLAAANASLEKLANLEINTVFPGHGEPFWMELFLKNHRLPATPTPRAGESTK
jgi:hydroxyacylglutathione hydrolase